MTFKHPKTGFNENNEVRTRSTEAECTLNVHEHSSTGFLLPNSIKTSFPFGIYIHWPYCLSKCPYCDFFSKVKKDVDQDELINGYLDDLNFYAEKTGDRTVTSIFFGGGTPSLIKPGNIEKVISHITAKWKLTPDVEISLEANPNTQTQTLFSDLRQAGINRLSLGVQALNDTDLKFLGRTHTYQEALYSIEQVLKNFDNHSMDLIYARPHQKLSDWQIELAKTVSFGFKHLSLYQLTIEEGTFFAKKGIQPLEEDAAALQYDFTNEYLETHGYPRYEVSNYAQPGFASRHNRLYWQGDDYLGIGPAAHGRIKLDNRFLATTHPRKMEELTTKERAEELIIMGLRLTAGIDKTHFQAITGITLNDFINPQALSELITLGLITETANTLQATTSGFLVLNKLIEELCS